MRTWHDPHARHAALVHLPITLGVLGLAPLIWFAWTGFSQRVPRVICLAWFMLAAVGAFVASQAGEAAEPLLASSRVPMTPTEAAAVHDHEEWGETAWLWPLGCSALVAITHIPRRSARLVAGSLAIAVGAGSAASIAYTAHLGGRLVYIHGLGVPERLP